MGDDMKDIILSCPTCGKVDVSKEHIKNCSNLAREEEQDNLWK